MHEGRRCKLGVGKQAAKGVGEGRGFSLQYYDGSIGINALCVLGCTGPRSVADENRIGSRDDRTGDARMVDAHSISRSASANRENKRGSRQFGNVEHVLTSGSVFPETTIMSRMLAIHEPWIRVHDYAQEMYILGIEIIRTAWMLRLSVRVWAVARFYA